MPTSAIYRLDAIMFLKTIKKNLSFGCTKLLTKMAVNSKRMLSLIYAYKPFWYSLYINEQEFPMIRYWRFGAFGALNARLGYCSNIFALKARCNKVQNTLAALWSSYISHNCTKCNNYNCAIMSDGRIFYEEPLLAANNCFDVEFKTVNSFITVIN